MAPPRRINLMVASSELDADLVKTHFPQLRTYTVLTPRDRLDNVRVGDYLWTPDANDLPASERMRLRGLMAPFIDEHSVEEDFPQTLLSW